MTQASEKNKLIRGLRSSPTEIQAALDALEGKQSESYNSLRRSKRVAYRHKNLIIYRQQSSQAIIVVGRNISRHGLAFLYGQYLAAGEVIRVVIMNKERGDWVDQKATVVRCQYVGCMIHEVGVEFKEALALEQLGEEPFTCPIFDMECPAPGKPRPIPLNIPIPAAQTNNSDDKPVDQPSEK